MDKPRQINPSVLVIVIILSIVFIFSGLLHILARCLGRRRLRHTQAPSAAISPRRLQQLFSLPDTGVERAVIDALPVFLYGSIRGLKDNSDCAVCLGEFHDEHKLRLLPRCKHAFHVHCIDAWLQGNSTCPLCRCSLLPEAEPATTAPPSPETNPNPQAALTTEKTVRVELGKVHTFGSGEGSSSRFARSFSMGEYEYMVRPMHRSARSEEVIWASNDFPRVCSPLRVQSGHREERHVVELVSTASSIPSRLLDPATYVKDVVVSIDGGESSKKPLSLKKSASLSWLRCDSGLSPSLKKLAPSRRLDSASVVMQPEEVAIDVVVVGERSGLLPSLKKSASLDWLRCNSGLASSVKKLAPSISLRRLDPAPVVHPEEVAIDVGDGGESSKLSPSLKKSVSLDWSRGESGLSPSLKKSASLSWLRGRSNKVFCAAIPPTEVD